MLQECLDEESNTVGIRLLDKSGNQMAHSSPITKWFITQVTIQLPDKKSGNWMVDWVIDI